MSTSPTTSSTTEVRAIAFMDTETLGLDHDAPIWEFAAIRRPAHDGDETRLHIMIKHDPTGWLDELPEPFAEDYQQRYDPALAYDERGAAAAIANFLDGAHIVGAVPNFDTTRLTRLLVRNGLAGVTRDARVILNEQDMPHRLPWHYHLIDIGNLAVGYLRGRGATVNPPYNSDDLSRMLGVEPDAYPRHTAMGDVLWIRDQYDVIMGGAQ